MKKQTRIAGIGKKIVNNWALKLFSVVAAFLLWLLVIRIEDPEDQKAFYNIPVKLVNTEILAEEDLVYEVLDKTDVVARVSVTAAKSIRDELSNSDIIAEADFQNLTVANTVEIRFYSQRYNDQISDITGSTEILKLNIEEKKTKRLSLDAVAVGAVASGHLLSEVSADQNRIEVSGPESVISRIASARVTVDVTDSTENISTYSDVILYDGDGQEIPMDNLDMNTRSVRVKVEILATKEIPIRYSVMGVPAAGYLFTGEIAGSAERVTIAAAPEVLATVSEIVVPEDALNITGQTENMVTNINVSEYLPEGVIFAEEAFKGKVTVTVYIEQEKTRELEIGESHIRLQDVPEGYTAELYGESSTYKLTVKGLEAEVAPINVATLYGTVSLSEYMEEKQITEPGIYEAEVSFQLPESITVTNPVKVHIRISKTEES